MVPTAHGTLNPLGFKIGLELLVKCEPRSVVEVPYTFVDRVCAGMGGRGGVTVSAG